jgi:hypothetical protein
MANWSGTHDIEGMERSLAGLTGAMRDAARLLRALAPVAEEMRSVQGALVEWQAAALGEPSMQTSMARPTPARRTVSVAVARVDGPLDAGVIERALAMLPGVLGVSVTRVDRGRLTAAVETDRSPAELRLHDALLAVFTEGVSGGWNGDAEFIAVVGPVVPAAGT